MNRDRYQLAIPAKGKLNQELILHIEEVLTHYCIQTKNRQIEGKVWDKKLDEIFDFMYQMIEFNE